MHLMKDIRRFHEDINTGWALGKQVRKSREITECGTERETTLNISKGNKGRDRCW